MQIKLFNNFKESNFWKYEKSIQLVQSRIRLDTGCSKIGCECSAANLHIHLHCLLLDGVYHLTDSGPVFQPVPAPTMAQLQTLLTRISTRLLKA